MPDTYPIVDMTTRGVEVVPHRGVNLATLGAELVPIRDALLELFGNGSAKSRVALQRLEVGLSITPEGRLAFTTGSVTASVTLTFERRLPAPSTRSTKAKAPESTVVTLD
jgi:hypothetical protein